MTRRIAFLLLTLFTVCSMHAQIVKAVSWSSSKKMTSDSEGVMTFTAKIEPGYHMYDMDVTDGPTPLSFNWTKLDGVKLVGKPTPSKTPIKQYDDTFEAELSWWTESVTLTQKFVATKENFVIEGYLKYMLCNDENCIPPTNEDFKFIGTAKLATTTDNKAEEVIPATPLTPAMEVTADSVAKEAAPAADSVAPGSLADNVLWAPVDANGSASGDSSQSSSGSLWYIIITCFIGGLIALLTPCVWPMISLTVSFFLKKSGNRAKSIRDAVTYGLSIIFIYVFLGVLITMIFGASSLNALATSAVCNIIFFLLLVVFAISFFGAFEITLPESWSNKMDSAAEKTTGLLSIFFMAFTLALVSFSCTGPIIGTLLVEAASDGNILGPAIGMFAFALALAIPFCIFAMFPSLLKGLPKSGGWMNTFKVTLAFLELALSLKFFSVADLAYGRHLMDREVFLALWIVIFALLGVYLLGGIRFKHDGEKSHTSVTRLMLAIISLAFAVYMVPGLWGAPLKAISAFAPPLTTQDFILRQGEQQSHTLSSYEEALQQAKRENKSVLLDFSGYGCVNCRKMEAKVLSDERVAKRLQNYVVVTLYVDDKTPLESPLMVTENGKEKVLKTVGDKWSYLQRTEFKANAQPYYIQLDADGKPVSGSYAYNENVEDFLNWLIQ